MTLETSQQQPQTSAADNLNGDFIRGISHPGGTICDVRKAGRSLFPYPMLERTNGAASNIIGVLRAENHDELRAEVVVRIIRTIGRVYQGLTRFGAVNLAALFVTMTALLGLQSTAGIVRRTRARWHSGLAQRIVGKKSRAVSQVCPIGTRCAFLIRTLDNGVQR